MTSQLGDFCSTAVLQPLLLGISSSKEIVNVSPKSFFGMERKKLLNLTTNRRLEVDKLKATQTFQTCLHVAASDSVFQATDTTLNSGAMTFCSCVLLPTGASRLCSSPVKH